MTGDVRLMHGDCLDRMAEVADGTVDLVCADLPYGTTACKWDVVIPFEPLWAHYRRVLKPRGAVVLTASQPFTSMLVMSNPKWFKWDDVWDKRSTVGHLNCRVMPLRRHESVLVFGPSRVTFNPQMRKGLLRKKGGYGHLVKDRRQAYGNHGANKPSSINDDYYPTSIAEFTGVYSTCHPTEKPVALMVYLIRTYSNPGDLVLDNAMGSGTTIIAAINAERRAIGIEKDPDIFRTAERRIAEHQSSMPLLAGVAS